jgi:hypothetical protein
VKQVDLTQTSAPPKWDSVKKQWIFPDEPEQVEDNTPKALPTISAAMRDQLKGNLLVVSFLPLFGWFRSFLLVCSSLWLVLLLCSDGHAGLRSEWWFSCFLFTPTTNQDRSFFIVVFICLLAPSH